MLDSNQLPLLSDLGASDLGSSGQITSRRSHPSRRVLPACTSRTSDRLSVCVLGSGSGGNSTALRFGGRVMLIDAGFGPRTTGRRLGQAGVDLDQVEAVCLTHLDRDHFRPTCLAMLLERRIRLYLHRWHATDLLRLDGADALVHNGLAHPFAAQAFEPLPGLRAVGVRLQHDLKGTIGYRFDSTAGSLGYATDLGHVPAQLIDLLAGVDLLCLECNYDEHMTIHSPRPSFVNRRNMSDSGHLSNEQSFDALRAISAASPPPNPQHVLLMHRSQQCNHPMKVKRVFERDPVLFNRIALTEQRRRTRWFKAKCLPAIERAQLQWGF